MLPLLQRELVDNKGWVTNEEITDYYAIGQCTPGVISVNVATFIGMKRKGVLGGIVATLGFITPAFLIIFIIASLLTSFASNIFVKNALAGIRVCVFSLVLYAIVGLAKKNIKDLLSFALTVSVALLAILVDVIPLYAYVIFAGFYGFFVCFIKDKIKKKKELKNINIDNQELKIEEKIEIKEETVIPEKKKRFNINYKDILLFMLGFFVGAIFGVFSFFSFYFVKNKKYKTGVSSSLIIWIILLIGLLILLFNDYNPIIFVLYGQFFKVGTLSLGGGLATLPFLKELGISTGWYNDLELANMLAVSESTPGGIGVNMSTYVGYTVAFNEFNGNYFLAFLGSIVSTLGLVSPSILIIIIISLILNKFKDNKYVNWCFYGLRAASLGLIIAALYSILKISIFNIFIDNSSGADVTLNSISYAFDNAKTEALRLYGNAGFFEMIGAFFNLLINFKNLAIALILGIGIFKFKKHPILYIAISATLGIVFNLYSVNYV